jgi:hypothetical protein
MGAMLGLGNILQDYTSKSVELIRGHSMTGCVDKLMLPLNRACF